MANWSDTEILITGNVFHIASALEQLNQHISNMCLSTDDGSMQLSDFTYTPESITIYGEGRWGAPINFFEKLFTTNQLSGSIVDSESGSDFFIEIEYADGEQIYHIADSYFSQPAINHYGLEIFEHNISYLIEEYEDNPDDWEANHADDIKLLLANNYTLNELKGIT